MVDFIGIRRVQELVADLGPAPFIAGLAREIEADYRRWGEFEKSPRHATHSSVGVIELMPACDGRQYAFKYVNGHPKNTAKGLLTVTAFGMLADVETGYPLVLSEMTLTTALRTAATSAVAARWMARAGSRVMALIGNGSQAEFQAIAFHDMLGIRELRLYDTDPAATDKLQENLARVAAGGIAGGALPFHCGGCSRRGYRDDRHRGQAQCHDPDTRDDRTRDASECGRRRLSGQDGIACRYPAAPRCACRGRVRAPVAYRRGDPAARRATFRSTELTEVVTGRKPGRGNDAEVTDLRFGRVRARGLLGVALSAPAASAAPRHARRHRSDP